MYPLTTYEETTSSVASILGTSFKNNTYEVPKYVGEGKLEAFNYDNFSFMLSCFKMHYDTSIGQTASDLEGYIDFAYILNGIADFFVTESNANISNMMYRIYINRPITVFTWFFMPFAVSP